MMHHLVPRKRERTEGDATPKSEQSQPEVKEEPEEQRESEEPASSEMQRRLRRSMDAFPLQPSSDSESSEPPPRRTELPSWSTDPCEYSESADPYVHLFHQTIWMVHDRDAVANEDPVTQIKSELWTIQANLETLRTQIGEVEGRRAGEEDRREIWTARRTMGLGN